MTTSLPQPRNPLALMLITRDPRIAVYAEAAAVDRIFVDLEKLGKVERQGHRDTVISDHQVADVAAMAKVLERAELLVRVDPWHDGSVDQIDQVIDAGAQLVMLPMFRTAGEVAAFIQAVGGRARTTLLLETAEALAAHREILAVDGIDEVMIGLNDLHLALGRDFMFELLTDGTVDGVARTVRERGIRLGVGGIARIGEGHLPAELIIGEHKRLGSSIVILSRTFHRNAGSLEELQAHTNLEFEVRKIRQAEIDADGRDPATVELDRLKTADVVGRVAAFIRARQRP